MSAHILVVAIDSYEVLVNAPFLSETIASSYLHNSRHTERSFYLMRLLQSGGLLWFLQFGLWWFLQFGLWLVRAGPFLQAAVWFLLRLLRCSCSLNDGFRVLQRWALHSTIGVARDGFLFGAK